MAITLTPTRELQKPASGDPNWDVPLLANMEALDAWLGKQLSKSVAGGADVALTKSEAAAASIIFTGALTADISVTLPFVGSWIVENTTTGAFTLTVKNVDFAGDAGVAVQQGQRATILLQSGKNTVWANDTISVATYEELRQITADAASVVLVTTAGIAGIFVKDASDTTSADNGGTILVSADSTRWKRQFGENEIDLLWFEPAADGVGDDLAKVNAAITALNGAGTVLLPPLLGVSDTVIVDVNEVLLKGLGRGKNAGNSKAELQATAGTRIAWLGAFDAAKSVVKYTADRNDTGTGTQKTGGGTVGVMIDCMEKAGTGLEVQSWTDGVFDVTVIYAVTIGHKLWTLSNGLATGIADNQRNDFSLFYGEANTLQNPKGIVIGNGAAGANTSLNVFSKIYCTTDGTGSALELENCDGNTFVRAQCGARTGTGGQVIFHADHTGSLSSNTHARQNTFLYAEFTKGVTAKKTVAGLDSSNNAILNYSTGNGAPDPIIETGATLYYYLDSGIGNGVGMVQPVFASDKTSAETELANVTNESMRIQNNSSNHMRLTNGSDEWGINIVGSNGNLRFFLVAGTGKIEFVNPMTADSYEVSDVKVVGARQTGWTAATGASSRLGFDTASTNTTQLAKNLKALIDDLIAHGLIGA